MSSIICLWPAGVPNWSHNPLCNNTAIRSSHRRARAVQSRLPGFNVSRRCQAATMSSGQDDDDDDNPSELDVMLLEGLLGLLLHMGAL